MDNRQLRPHACLPKTRNCASACCRLLLLGRSVLLGLPCLHLQTITETLSRALPRPPSRAPSSWISHYPTDGRRWGRVTGLGMNEEELRRNPMLDFYEVWLGLGVIWTG